MSSLNNAPVDDAEYVGIPLCLPCARVATREVVQPPDQGGRAYPALEVRAFAAGEGDIEAAAGGECAVVTGEGDDGGV